MSNIVEMPTSMNVLADRIKLAYGRAVGGRKGWIEGSLSLPPRWTKRGLGSPPTSISACGWSRTSSTGSARMTEPHCLECPKTPL